MVLSTLMGAMSLVRRCRVNPALTIQLFSQLFHFISAWLFNQLLSAHASARGLRSRCWGAALRRRLLAIEGWAERQGLELAAGCHLGPLIQVRSHTSAGARCLPAPGCSCLSGCCLSGDRAADHEQILCGGRQGHPERLLQAELAAAAHAARWLPERQR